MTPRILPFKARFLRVCKSPLAAVPEPFASASLSGSAGPAPVLVKRL